MAYQLPHILIGTTRVDPGARASFGDFLDAAPESGRGALLTEGSAWIWEALRASRRRNWDVCALVPHVAGYVREATDYGLFGAGWRRLRRIHPLSWGRLSIQGLRHVGRVLRRDFPALLTMLLEMEMAGFRRASPPVVFLHPQITDLLLAMDHAAALGQAVSRIRRGFRAEPGLATNNLGVLLPRLQAWGLEVSYLLAPVHPDGYGMRPSQRACEEGLASFKGRLVARTETEIERNVAAYWQLQGVASVLYDVSEPGLAEWKRWSAWRHMENDHPAVTGQATAQSSRDGFLCGRVC